LTLFEG